MPAARPVRAVRAPQAGPPQCGEAAAGYRRVVADPPAGAQGQGRPLPALRPHPNGADASSRLASHPPPRREPGQQLHAQPRAPVLRLPPARRGPAVLKAKKEGKRCRRKVGSPKGGPMKFGTAIVDPPWPYRVPKVSANGSRSKQTGYSGHVYKPLDIDDLAARPVGDWVADIVLLWTTGPMMPAAARLIEAWGFEWVTLTYWVKTSPQGYPQESFDGRVSFKRHMGVGYWFRGDVEPVV